MGMSFTNNRKPALVRNMLINRRILDNQKESFRPVHAGHPEIPHKPKKSSPVETNGDGHGQQNGKHSPDDEMVVDESKGTKRALPDDESPPFKKAKIIGSADDDVVVVEDAGGAIVIDD
jgi:ubiquitin-like 1-activating enzyme E1 B